MTLELAIFFIVAAVAIFSAAFMLISNNAVHSALFLVTNLACVALFYLMLNAPFLAMIQITVYAGAIMVLFMFVIMLLGAEKIGGAQGPYRWLVPAAVALTTVFMIVAFIIVVQGNVGLLKPVPANPELRVVHAIPGAPAVDIYLNDTKSLDTVAYQGATEFGKVLPGEYVAKVFLTCPDNARCADPIASKTKPVLETNLKLDSETTTTVVLAGTLDQPKVILAPTDLSTLTDEDTLRLQAVNTLPTDTIQLIKVDPATENLPPDNAGKKQAAANAEVVIPDLAPGMASGAAVLTKGNYDFVWMSGDTRLLPVPDFIGKPKTSELLVLTQEMMPSSGTARPTLIRVGSVPTNESYGSPQQIGYGLLSTFLLPFELVSLLLLAAMVGAIILTREEVVKRVRQRRVVSESAVQINRAVAASQPNAESSAD
ncbi:MAG: NADH-quinone oxidoreductase subunit J [Chloroflexota bacterium]